MTNIQKNIKMQIRKILCEMGIYINDINIDYDLNDYLLESIQFISFIAQVEQELNIELPDDMLIVDAVKSLDAFSERISDLISE